MAEIDSILVGEVEIDVEIKASAEQFYEMYTGKSHHVAQATPNNVQGFEHHDGELGSVGSVISWNYVHDGKPKVAKEIVEEVDEEKKLVRFRVIEGDLMEEFESFVITVQVTPVGDGPGSIVKLHFDFIMINENANHPENLLPFFVEMIKEVDEHLISAE